MKKLFNFALFGAMALTGAVGFSACSSSDDVVNNPDFDPETNTVKTEFTISLPSNVASKTRMASADVQEGGYSDFRGMTNIYLLPFNGTVTTSNTGSLSINGAAIQLADITKDATGKQLDNTAKNSVVYNDVSIQTLTSSFLFYAKAAGEKSSRDAADKFKLGSLKDVNDKFKSAMTSVDGVTFGLESIIPSTNTSACAGSTIGGAIVTLLNNIAGTTDNSSTPVTWANAPDPSLGALYTSFTSLKAGSSTSVEAALGKLYASLKTFSDGTVGSANGSNKQIADNIRSKISSACSTAPAADATSITLSTTYQGYPADINLPDGAARVNWSGTAFTGMSTAETGFGEFAKPSAYTYPASLYYWTNSPLVAATEKKSDQYSSTTYTSWADVVKTTTGGLYNGAATSVTSETRSIALVNQIQYAVGRLDTYVKIGDNSGTQVTLKDKEDATVAVPTGGFVLTGVLVGGQNTVGWNFEPNSTSGQSTIYDKDVVSNITASSTTLSGPNYTLVLETAADAEIKVALEFQNGDKEFVGADGYIPAGSKFYLIGDLKPVTGANADDATKTGGKVFKQDYKTIANFTIGENSLKKAYNTLPDLRRPELELGLSVDLTWQEGITFNVEF